MPGVPDHDLGGREQRIVETPELLSPQVVDPVDDDPADVVADGEEPGRERLGEFRLHLPRILVDPALVDVDVLELEGCDRPVAGTGQDGEGNERPVAALDLGAGRHRLDDMPDLLQRRHPRIPVGFGDPRLLGRQVEIFGIGVGNPGLVPRLSGQPDEEPLQRAECGVERRLAEPILGPNAHLFSQVRLEALGLLDVERLEVAEPGIGFEPIQKPSRRRRA